MLLNRGARLSLALGLLLYATPARAQFGKDDEPADTRTSAVVDSIHQRRVRDCGGNTDLVACEAAIQQTRIRRVAEEKASRQAAEELADRERVEEARRGALAQSTDGGPAESEGESNRNQTRFLGPVSVASNWTSVGVVSGVLLEVRTVPGARADEAAKLVWRLTNRTGAPVFLDGNWTSRGTPVAGTFMNGQAAGSDQDGGALAGSRLDPGVALIAESYTEKQHSVSTVSLRIHHVRSGSSTASGRAN